MIQMELRHLRYFIAVAEEGGFSNAAERRLHTAQPSLSRQMRDLELEVGVKLLERKARGMALTAAGRVFLDHARLTARRDRAYGAGESRVLRGKRPDCAPATGGRRAENRASGGARFTIFLPQ